MLKSSVAAPLADKDKPVDREFLRGRFVRNVGSNVVRIEPDLFFNSTLEKNNQKPISSTILKPGEQAWLRNFLVVIFTDNHERAKLEHIFSASMREGTYESADSADLTSRN